MNTRACLLTAGLLALYSAPAFAVSDNLTKNDINSGFGRDLFAGDSAPAFEDPSFQDPESLNDIAPSAGDDSVVSEDIAPAAGIEKKEFSPGTGGMKSTVLGE